MEPLYGPMPDSETQLPIVPSAAFCPVCNRRLSYDPNRDFYFCPGCKNRPNINSSKK